MIVIALIGSALAWNHDWANILNSMVLTFVFAVKVQQCVYPLPALALAAVNTIQLEMNVAIVNCLNAGSPSDQTLA